MILTDNTAVLVLWWIALALTVSAIVPIALWLLRRTYLAARDIRRFTAETLEAGLGIARHTAAIPALDATIAAAGPLIEKADAIRDATAELERTLRSRAG